MESQNVLVMFVNICLCLGTSKKYEYILKPKNTSNKRIDIEPGSSLTLVCQYAEKFNNVEWLLNGNVQARIYTERCQFDAMHTRLDITSHTCSSDKYSITYVHLNDSGEWLCRFYYTTISFSNTLCIDTNCTDWAVPIPTTVELTSTTTIATDDPATSTFRNGTTDCNDKDDLKYAAFGCLVASLLLNVGLGIYLLVSRRSNHVKQNVTNEPVAGKTEKDDREVQEADYLQPCPDWSSVPKETKRFTKIISEPVAGKTEKDDREVQEADYLQPCPDWSSVPKETKRFTKMTSEPVVGKAEKDDREEEEADYLLPCHDWSSVPNPTKRSRTTLKIINEPVAGKTEKDDREVQEADYLQPCPDWSSVPKETKRFTKMTSEPVVGKSEKDDREEEEADYLLPCHDWSPVPNPTKRYTRTTLKSEPNACCKHDRSSRGSMHDYAICQ